MLLSALSGRRGSEEAEGVLANKIISGVVTPTSITLQFKQNPNMWLKLKPIRKTGQKLNVKLILAAYLQDEDNNVPMTDKSVPKPHADSHNLHNHSFYVNLSMWCHTWGRSPVRLGDLQTTRGLIHHAQITAPDKYW